MKSLPCLLAAALGCAALSAYGADAAANWTDHCSKCHGPDGRGDTKMGHKLHIADFTDAEVQAKFTDADAVKAVKEGVKSPEGKLEMKPIEGLNDEEIQALVKYVRAFQK